MSEQSANTANRPRSLESYRLTDAMRSALLYLLDRTGEYPGSPSTWKALTRRKLTERYQQSGPGLAKFWAVRLTNEGRRIARVLRETA